MTIIFNGEPREAEDNVTVGQLLQQLNLQSKYVAVEVNLEVVSREAHAKRVLRDGDRLEVVTLVGGG